MQRNIAIQITSENALPGGLSSALEAGVKPLHTMQQKAELFLGLHQLAMESTLGLTQAFQIIPRSQIEIEKKKAWCTVR
jgi:hypothetical protein